MTNTCDCTTCRENTVREYLVEILQGYSSEEKILRIIELYDEEQKFRDEQLMEAREEHEKTVAKLNAYRSVLTDIIRYGVRWD